MSKTNARSTQTNTRPTVFSGWVLRIPYKTRERILAIALLLPAFIVMILVVGYPLVYSIRLSFFEKILTSPKDVPPFIGLQNYINVIRDPLYLESWLLTFKYVFISTAISFLIGFGLALLLNRPMRGGAFITSLFLIPWLVPSTVTATLSRLLFSPQFGGLNLVLFQLGIINEMYDWYTSPSLALPAILAVNIWRSFPYMMVMLLAGLKTISHELYEAADIDGAGWFGRLRYITLPSIRGIIAIVTLVSIIWNFQQFSTIYIPTKGGPATATTTLAINLYKTAFYGFDHGKAATMGTLWLLFLLGFSALYLRIFSERDQ
jgi:multiple sugar transport system permease protein